MFTVISPITLRWDLLTHFAEKSKGFIFVLKMKTDLDRTNMASFISYWLIELVWPSLVLSIVFLCTKSFCLLLLGMFFFDPLPTPPSLTLPQSLAWLTPSVLLDGIKGHSDLFNQVTTLIMESQKHHHHLSLLHGTRCRNRLHLFAWLFDQCFSLPIPLLPPLEQRLCLVLLCCSKNCLELKVAMLN